MIITLFKKKEIILMSMLFQKMMDCCFGLPRLMLAIVTMRGMSASATAVRATTVRTLTVMFGWCVDDSVFSFCLVTLTGKPTLTLDDFWIY